VPRGITHYIRLFTISSLPRVNTPATCIASNLRSSGLVAQSVWQQRANSEVVSSNPARWKIYFCTIKFWSPTTLRRICLLCFLPILFLFLFVFCFFLTQRDSANSWAILNHSGHHLFSGIFIFNRSRVSELVTLHFDSKPISVLCHMGDFGCGDGGWTPVMKIDGNKVY